MSLRSFTLAAALASALAPLVAFAGGPAPENRAGTFARTCKNNGSACIDDAGCPGSVCVVPLARGALSALVTIIVDDNVSKYDGSEAFANVNAATLLVEVRKDGTHLFAQTYQNLNGADLDELVANLQGGAFFADTFDPLTEATLNTAAAQVDVLGRFLFQSGDTHLANALRALAVQTGQPVVIGVPKKLEQVIRDDHGADALASVIRIKVKIGFTAP